MDFIELLTSLSPWAGLGASMFLLAYYIVSHPKSISRVAEEGENLQAWWEGRNERKKQSELLISMVSEGFQSFELDEVRSGSVNKVRFVKNEKDVGILFDRDNCGLLNMPYSQNTAKTLVNALEIVVPAKLPISLSSTDKTIYYGTIYTTIFQMIKSAGGNDAVDYFKEDYLPRKYEKDADLRMYVNVMNELHKQGYFTRILMKVLSIIRDKESDSINTDNKVKVATRKFVDFLNTILVEGNKREPLDFLDECFNVSLILIGKYSTAILHPESYNKQFNSQQSTGAKLIFVIAKQDALDRLLDVMKQAELYGNVKLLKKQTPFTREYKGQKLDYEYVLYEVLSRETAVMIQ